MAAAVRLNLLLLVAVTFQMSHVAACIADEQPQTSQQEASESVGNAPAAEAPTCVKDETSRRRLAEMCSEESCRVLATEAPTFAASIAFGQLRFAVVDADRTPAMRSLQTERIRLQV